MGITIECEKTGTGYDMGYGGFGNFREKVAELFNSSFSEHYKKLSTPEMMFCFDEEKKKAMFEEYDRKAKTLIEENHLSTGVVSFLLQSDCEGYVSPQTCKLIYDIIKDYDDNICYGYVARPDCTMFHHLKSLFLECYKNDSPLIWS